MSKWPSCLLLLLLLAACGHRKAVEQPVRLPVFTQALLDSNTSYYIRMQDYPKSKNLLPIGVVGRDSVHIAFLEHLLTCDDYDNITGQPQPDGIRDFAGEYVRYAQEPDSLGMDDSLFLAKNSCVQAVIPLLQQHGDVPPCKLLVIDNDVVSIRALDEVRSFLQFCQLEIPVVSTLQSGIQAVLGHLGKPHAQQRERLGTVGVLAPERTLQLDGYHALEEACQVVSQPFEPTQVITLTNPYYPLNASLVPAYNFDYSGGGISYRGSRYTPSYMRINNMENTIRYFMVCLAEQMRKGRSEPLTYLVLGHDALLAYKPLITEMLLSLRNYRKDGRYVYRHLIDPNVVIIDARQEAAKDVYAALLAARLPAYRPTASKTWLEPPFYIDSALYPFLHVSVSH